MDTIANIPVQSGSNDPKSYAEALLRPDADRWIEAWEVEKESILLTSLASPITYSQLPPDAVVIDSMAVFKKKTDGRYKVRVVLRGDRQPADSVSDNLYAPTVRITILRAFTVPMCMHMGGEYGGFRGTPAYVCTLWYEGKTPRLITSI